MRSNANKSWWGQVAHNRLIAMVLIMLMVVPMLGAPLDIVWRGAAALAYEGMALLLMATLLWRARWNFSRAHLIQFAKTGMNLPVALFGIWAALSCLFAGHNAYGAQHLLCLGAGILLYFVVSTQFRRSEQLQKLVDTLVVITTCVSLLGFAQYSMGTNMEAVSLFGDHQLFGSFLMILLPLVGVMALTEKKPGRQIAAQIATVLAITALFISQARSAWIGSIAGIVVMVVLSLVTAQRNRTLGRNKHEVVVPIMLLGVAAGFFLLLWPQTSKLITRATSLKNGAAVETFKNRQVAWRGAEKIIAGSPIVGIGLGQYEVVQSRYTRVGVGLTPTMRGASLGEQAHSFYLQTTAELGVVGMALFIGILLTFWILGIYRALHMDGGIRRSLLLGSLGATIAFAIDAFASPSWQLGQIAMFLWLSLGVGMSCLRVRSRSEEVEELEEPTIPARISRPATVFGALAVALLLPTVVFAGGGSYDIPTLAYLRPKGASLAAGNAITYQLFVRFSNGMGGTQDIDVTSSPDTTFTYSVVPTGTPPGVISGTSHQTYTAAAGEHDRINVVGSYSQPSYPTFSDNGVLVVHP